MNKNLNTITLFLAALIGIFASCNKAEQTKDFRLYYPGVTDIGPSTNLNVNPSWYGAAPSDFTISGISLDGNNYTTDCFTVNPEKGILSIHDTGNLPLGLYAISIDCKSSGKKYSFKDVIKIKMMRAVPEGISVEPNPLEVKLSDVVSPSENTVLPRAVVKTVGEHISITAYKICAVKCDGVPIPDYSKLFKISQKGEISITGGYKDFVAGVYSLDLKLNTFVAGDDSSEGIFENALTVNITSVPMSISYSSEIGRVEAGQEFVSPVPVVEGSKKGLRFTLKSVTPQGTPVTLDPATGVISIAAGNTLKAGDVLKVSLSVANAYGSADFEEAYQMLVVAYIKPVSDFSYSVIEDVCQGSSFSVPVQKIEGDFVSYSFAETLPDALSELMIDAQTGEVYAKKGNHIPTGQYKVKVRAENAKNSMIAECAFGIINNPYVFTFFRYGNNLGLSPEADYADQFRIKSEDGSLVIPVAGSDIPAGVPVKWEVKKTWCRANVTINESTGELKVPYSKGRMTDFVTVSVKVGGDSDAAVTMEKPVFFNHVIPNMKAGLPDGVTILYSPFVFCCNPKKGGRSAAPVITGSGYEPAQFAMDYRRAFNYFNLNGPESHKDGQPSAGGFMSTLWEAYFAGMGKPFNKGSRDPLSYFSGSESLRLGYVDQSDFAVVINPDKFRDDAGYANGVFSGQIIFGKGSGDPVKAHDKNGDFPIIIWFDTKFQ